SFGLTSWFVKNIQDEMDWFQRKGEDVVGAFILPPLQVVASAINFCTFLISAQHLFQIPFKSIREVLSSRELLHQANSKRKNKSDED
ncbi:MAG: hypothetical protein AABZ55_05045, partial [Bdellovibrionota bacterium]